MTAPEAQEKKSISLKYIIVALVFVIFISPLMILIVNNRPPNITVPAPKMPKPNGWDDFVQAGKMAHPPYGPYSQANKEPEEFTMSEYKAFLAANSPALAVLRQGLAKPYMQPQSRSFNSKAFENFTRFRELARSLSGEAKYFDITNQPEKATNSRLDCIEFGETIPHGGTLITALVGSSLEAIGSYELEPQISKLSPEALARIAARIEQVKKKRIPFCEIVLSEGESDAAMNIDQISNPKYLASVANPILWTKDEYDFLGSTPTSADKIENIKNNMHYAFQNKAAIVRKNRQFYRALAAEQKGYYTGKSSIPIPNNRLAPMINWAKMRDSFTKRETALCIIETEVALRRYMIANGRYPQRLSALAPVYLKSATVDPFGLGKPLCYKVINGGKDYHLYSVGPNMKDDGGMVVSRLRLDTDGDMVAGKLFVKQPSMLGRP